MSEATKRSDPVFIDVASGSEQFNPQPINDDMIKDEKVDNGTNAENASTLPSCLNIQPRRIRCTECPKYTAENEEKMLRHVKKVHRGENPFQCYMCDYSTYNKSLFEEHVRIHQGIKPFKCSHCPYRSASKKNTKKHELIHRPDNPHKCQHCGFIARHLRSLQCHLNTVHSSMDEKDLTQCPHCKKKVEDYGSHEKNRQQCSECAKLFCNKNLLRKHMLGKHGDKNKTSKADFVCAICKWSSNVRPRILLHLIHHPNQPVDDSVVDVNILKLCGIMGPGW